MKTIDEMTSDPETLRCLRHYATRKPKDFAQLDGFDAASAVPGLGDPTTGRMVCVGGTTELMVGAPVRVLLPLDVTPETALQLLADIQEFLAKLPPGAVMQSIVEYEP